MSYGKRKVLIISYVWPPMEGVGLMRAMKFVKYLPENGWEPIVLTIKAEKSAAQAGSIPSCDTKVFRSDYRDVAGEIKRLFSVKRARCGNDGHNEAARKGCEKSRRSPSFIREMVLIPDDQIGWYKFAVDEGRKIVGREGVDLIISTSPPETAHLIGRALKKAFNIPWVADLRDLWSEDHFRERPFIKKLVLRRIEKTVLKDADRVVTVSEPWAETLRLSLGAGKNKVEVIENGFDEEDFGKAVYGGNKKFTISYTGKLHADKQPVAGLFKILKDLIGEGRIDRDRIQVDFYVMGYAKPDISEMARSYGLNGVVFEHGMVDYKRSLEIQRVSDVLLFIQWQGRGGDGWYSAKIYDYIGSGRPILALAGKRGIVADLISETSSGIMAEDEVSLREALLKLYCEHVENGFVKYAGNEANIANHSRKMRARKLAALLDSVITKGLGDGSVRKVKDE
ncbi:MAG: glycosyltransferase [Candidatus Omnitrophica bacterium]|nr:glycosyltransferase [Candidatus Omnitrophota bacterium]MBU1808664.1 glycosyltransferase [Candidatus Omnitrophota bacterium]